MHFLDNWVKSHSHEEDFAKWAVRHAHFPSVETCPRGEWLIQLGRFADVDNDRLHKAVTPAFIRSFNTYLPQAFERIGRGDIAKRFRNVTSVAEVEALLHLLPHSPSSRESLYFVDMVNLASRIASWFLAKMDNAFIASSVGIMARLAAQLHYFDYDRQQIEFFAEHSLCADDVRAALPNLQEQVDKLFNPTA